MNESSKILLRRKHMLVLDKHGANTVAEKKFINRDYPEIAIGESQSAYLLCLLKNIESLGFTFSKKLISEIVKKYSSDEIGQLYINVLPQLKRMVGSDVKYNPMYRNFPEYVRSESHTVLFMNAIMHYISYGVWMPGGAYDADTRLPLVEDTSLKVIDLGTEEDIKELAKNIIGSSTSISSKDEEDLLTIMSEYNIMINPEDVKYKENIALICKFILDTSKGKRSDLNAIKLYPFFDGGTATDVLRLAVAMCDGDRSLANNTKFTRFSRPDRRLIMNLLTYILSSNSDNDRSRDVAFGPVMVFGIKNLNKFYDVLADMNKYRQRWIRLAEVIHSGEYTKDPNEQYYLAAMAIQVVRTNNCPESFAHQVERYYFMREFDKMIDTLQNRPGEFGRRLDSMLREIFTLNDASKANSYANKLLVTYKKIASKISSNELLQILSHFKNRLENEQDDMRVFFPKGNTQKYYITKNTMTSIPVARLMDVIKITNEALIEVYSPKKGLGNVYISETMKNYMAPTHQRSASSVSDRPITRGSHFPINENAKCLRAFVWWTNTEPDYELQTDSIAVKYLLRHERGATRVDIDLSSGVLDEDFNKIGEIWYGHLKSNTFNGYHSGDITNGGDFNGEGVSEFVDVDIDSIVRNGGRYVSFTVHSFTNQPFNTLKHLKFGWMERENPDSGEIYEPKTVKMAMSIDAEATSIIPVLFDCVKREVIWADLPTGSIARAIPNNILTTTKQTNYAIKSILFSGKTDMYTLIELNAKARGRITQDRSMADTIFEPVEETEANEPLDERIKVYSPFDVDFFMGDLL